MSAATLSGLQPIAAAAAGGGEPIAATAAGERIQQLQTLLEQVEQGPSAVASKGFASALDAAQAGNGSSATAGAYTTPLVDTTLTAEGSAPPTTASGVPYTPSLLADGSSSAAGPVDATYTSTVPTTVAYQAVTAAGANTATGGGSTYAPMIQQAAARYGIDPSVLYGLIEQESGFDPSATSSAGAQGLTQLMPSTAASLGVSQPLDPAQSIEGGARYLSGLLRQFAGNTTDALAAYNAGPGAVEQYGGVPPYPETQQYVAKVLGYAASYSPSEQDTSALPSTTPALTGATAAPVTASATSEAIA
ncbi:MAG: lytic transglycosylase domain-containing protein [Solirubrobacteraceae bacterium]